VETVLEAVFFFIFSFTSRTLPLASQVGVTERTTDPEFDMYSANFQDMMEDMNECGAALTAVLLNQKVFIKDAVELVRAPSLQL
jgi:hypothetical protein